MLVIKLCQLTNFVANTFPLSEKWSRTIQRVFSVINVYRPLANFIEEESIMKVGDTFNKDYITDPIVNDVGAGGSISRQDLTITSEPLTIDQEKEVTFNIRASEKLQEHLPVAMVFAKRASVLLGNKLDADHFAEYDNAVDTIDDGDIGGTAGRGLTLANTNVYRMFTIADRKQSARNVPENNRWVAISYQFREKLIEYLGNRDTRLGDEVTKNGYLGKLWGRKVYLSNNLSWSARLEMGTVPTVGDTTVINGVTFTWADTGDVDTAGEIYYGLNAGAALDNLVASINAPGTDVAGIFTALSTANQNLLSGITATDGATYMTLKGVGKSAVVVSETLSAVADIWTLNYQEQHCLFGQGKPISMVVQKYPTLDTRPRDGYISDDYITWMLYGVKTFNDGATQLLDCQIRSDNF